VRIADEPWLSKDGSAGLEGAVDQVRQMDDGTFKYMAASLSDERRDRRRRMRSTRCWTARSQRVSWPLTPRSVESTITAQGLVGAFGGGGTMELVRALHESIGRTCDIPVDRIRDESTLEELGVDSLASAEILTDLEIRLGRDLPVDALRRFEMARTVGDVSALLAEAFGEVGDRTGP
jgi:acyl carrier protein